jgi:hypothetical protein
MMGIDVLRMRDVGKGKHTHQLRRGELARLWGIMDGQRGLSV